jgi:hypothetical protein
MNHPITLALYKDFVKRGFAVLRFNFRGVGKSQGIFDNGVGELSDAAARSTGSSRCIPKPRRPGSPASRSARGSACSC